MKCGAKVFWLYFVCAALVAMGFALSGCGSDMTARMQGLTLQQKGTIPGPCRTAGNDTNSNSMFGAEGAVPAR